MAANNGTCVPEWDVWQGLTEEQRRYEFWRILKMLDTRTRSIKFYASGGGVIGGAIAVFGILAFKITIGA